MIGLQVNPVGPDQQNQCEDGGCEEDAGSFNFCAAHSMFVCVSCDEELPREEETRRKLPRSPNEIEKYCADCAGDISCDECQDFFDDHEVGQELCGRCQEEV